MRQVWYQAGVEAGRRRATRWRAAAGLAGAAAAASFAINVRPLPAEPTAVRVVYLERATPPVARPAARPAADPTPPAADPAAASAAAAAYLRFCDTLAQQKGDAIPPSPPRWRAAEPWPAPGLGSMGDLGDMPARDRFNQKG